MKKYIDADKLIAEIERLDEKYRLIRVGKNIQQAREADLVIHVLLGLSNFIESLQQVQPEVDLEKEANECWDYVFSAIGWNENSLMTMNHKEFLAFARHFYELGLNARKEE